MSDEASHIFAAEPDARQADTRIETSRFRPRYRTLEPAEVSLHDAIKAQAEELEKLFLQVKPGRYRSLSITALEEAVMWNIKELTS